MTSKILIDRNLLETLSEIRDYQDAGWFCPCCDGFAPTSWATGGVRTPVKHEEDCALEELRALLKAPLSPDHSGGGAGVALPEVEMGHVMLALEMVKGAPMMTSNQCQAMANLLNGYLANKAKELNQ